jgi:hypothetical protein
MPGDADSFASRAAEAWLHARDRADVAAALDGVERLYEVPFSLTTPEESASAIVRGTIDCVVRKAGGELLVVELKTGRRRTAHERQLDLYVRAARALHPGSIVSGVLLYV